MSKNIVSSELAQKLIDLNNDGYDWDKKHIVQLITAHDTEKKQQVLEALPEKKNKDPSNYINEPNLRAWQDGYNKCLSELRQAIEKVYGDTSIQEALREEK